MIKNNEEKVRKNAGDGGLSQNSEKNRNVPEEKDSWERLNPVMSYGCTFVT